MNSPLEKPTFGTKDQHLENKVRRITKKTKYYQPRIIIVGPY